MGLNLECDQCGKNPKTDDVYECGHCGEEFCSECLPEDMINCLKCSRVYHPSCLDKLAMDDRVWFCVWCGDQIERLV